MTPLTSFTTSDKQTVFELIQAPSGMFLIYANGKLNSKFSTKFQAEEKFYKLKSILG